jgi:hypothetical protein
VAESDYPRGGWSEGEAHPAKMKARREPGLLSFVDRVVRSFGQELLLGPFFKDSRQGLGSLGGHRCELRRLYPE